MKLIGYWEEYKCGCVSKTYTRKKDLVGYCPKHGSSLRRTWKEFAEGDFKQFDEEIEKKPKI